MTETIFDIKSLAREFFPHLGEYGEKLVLELLELHFNKKDK